MLIQFDFNNFRSFRDDASLDLTATKMTEHANHIVEIGGDRLLPVAAIFGANASGKSNVYKAFKYMSYYVVRSFGFGGDSTDDKQSGSRTGQGRPFLFDKDSKNEPSTFEVFFIDNKDEKEKTYQYGFSLLGNEVVEEWLYSKAKTARNSFRKIFYRRAVEDLDLEGLGRQAAKNVEAALEKETLIVSLGAKLKIEKLKRIRDWFVSNEVLDFGNPRENSIRSQMLPEHFEDDINVRHNVVDFFATFDDSIKAFDVEAKTAHEAQDEYEVSTEHKIAGGKDYEKLDLGDESGGTQKMFALYPSLKRVFETGGVMFVDELNAKLHPLLMRNVILTFANKNINTNHAQLIFTTHDIWQFSNELLRRDEIWITEKDPQGVSTLYSVAEFRDNDGNKARKNEALSKNYLTGEYGGIPALKPLTMLKENETDDTQETGKR